MGFGLALPNLKTKFSFVSVLSFLYNLHCRANTDGVSTELSNEFDILLSPFNIFVLTYEYRMCLSITFKQV